MKTNFVKVPARGITAEEILALWQEGKLYRREEPIPYGELLARCQQEAIVYVSSIDEFVAPAWRSYIKNVWRAIVYDVRFTPFLLMKQKHEMNRYFVTALVYNLQVLGIYEPVEEVSMLKLHLKLEGISKRNSIFKNWEKYAPMNAQRRILNDIITNIHRV